MATKRAHVIVMANQKGGCGKTTTSINLAAGLALAGHSTVMVDLDPQCNATSAFGIVSDDLADEGRFTMADAFVKSKPAAQIEIPLTDRFEGRLSVLPGHRALDQVKETIDAELRHKVINDKLSEMEEDDLRVEARFRLRKSLASLVSERDFIIIDTPPRLDFGLTSAFLAADFYIIPVFPSRYDVDGLSRLTGTVQKIRERGNARLKLLGVALGRFKARTNLHKQVREKIRSTFPEQMFETIIHDSVKHDEATFHRYKTIFESNPSDEAAHQFAALANEVIARVKSQQGGGVAPAPMVNEPPVASPTAEEVANG